jgi:hypothetical protein
MQGFFFSCLLLLLYSQEEIYSATRCRTPTTTRPLAYETKFHTHTKDYIRLYFNFIPLDGKREDTVLLTG